MQSAYNGRKILIGTTIVAIIIIAAIIYYLKIPPSPPTLQNVYEGTAYVSGEGGHIVYFDLKIYEESRVVETDSLERVVISQPIYSLTLSQDKNTLFVGTFTKEGYIGILDLTFKPPIITRLTTTNKSGKYCGGFATANRVYLSSMEDGTLQIYDKTTLKFIDQIRFEKTAICSVIISPDGKYLYASDADGKIWTVDPATKEIIKSRKLGTFFHRSSLTPDNRYILQSESGAKPEDFSSARVLIIDRDNEEVVGSVPLPGVDVYDVVPTPDGKFAIVAVREPAAELDSLIWLVDLDAKKPLNKVSICKPCHEDVDVTIPSDKKVFSGGIQVVWKG